MKSNDHMGAIHGMNLNAFDLNLLRVLDALLKERSVTRAGERIGLSQPAVSAALNRLRHHFGDQLLVRSGNDMLPTPRAEALQESVRRALGLVEGVLGRGEAFDARQLDRTVTLLGADFFATTLVPALSRELAVAAPKVRLRMLDSARGDVGRLLQDDVIDAALERPLVLPDWIASEVLFHSPFAVIARPDEGAIAAAGLAPGAVMPLDLFCALPHVLRSIDGGFSGATDAALASIGRERRVVLTVPQFHAVSLAVAQGGVIAVVPCQFAEKVAGPMGLAIYRTPLPIPAPAINLYWHARHTGEPAHRWLRALIVAEVRRLGFEAVGEAYTVAS